MDPRSSADAVDKRNGLHQCARRQAEVDKKTEFSLLKKRSEILAPLLAHMYISSTTEKMYTEFEHFFKVIIMTTIVKIVKKLQLEYSWTTSICSNKC